ncbi:2'-5' RNA ligase family protein [Streptomyces goshikiensis]|uniref:hypothetical protein n=1 Tax=Streptomyces goshikiensis TaxID=1942 RepID=UPI0037105FFF
MHRTLLHAIGLGRDDVDVNALVKDVESCVSTAGPITLTFDRPAIGPFAVELSGWPGCPFTALVDAVTQATARTGATVKPGPSRYPHLSVAYTTADAAGREGTGTYRPCGTCSTGCSASSTTASWPASRSMKRSPSPQSPSQQEQPPHEQDGGVCSGAAGETIIRS